MKFRAFNEEFIEKWPSKFKLNGWLVGIKSGGELAPHMHEEGWISGAVYIHVPEKQHANSGNFAVCIDNEGIEQNTNKKSTKKIIDVETGSLSLFPSSLMHYTIPFEAKKDRIVLAFDIVPI